MPERSPRPTLERYLSGSPSIPDWLVPTLSTAVLVGMATKAFRWNRNAPPLTRENMRDLPFAHETSYAGVIIAASYPGERLSYENITIVNRKNGKDRIHRPDFGFIDFCGDLHVYEVSGDRRQGTWKKRQAEIAFAELPRWATYMQLFRGDLRQLKKLGLNDVRKLLGLPLQDVVGARANAC